MSWREFLAMGGYGPYVWGAYGVSFALLALEVLLLIGRRCSAARHAARPGIHDHDEA